MDRDDEKGQVAPGFRGHLESMGVSGLTTYLRENKRLLSKTLQLASSSTSKALIVVDGWS